ncbi:PP2C family protein-serine/threonine phosphatase [Thermodesulfobacteriota bacterium]
MTADIASRERLQETVESLREEVAVLRTEKAAVDAQRKILENMVEMARSSAEGHMLQATLQKSLNVSAELAGAENGSLFLLDSEGRVTDSILTRSDATPEQRRHLIGSVLDKGLAGWVRSNRRIGLIEDTETDERWLRLPNQPYTARSALAVPILRGDDLTGILTLLHSKPDHFPPQTAALVQATANQIALVLQNAWLYAKLEESYQKVEAYSQALNRELEQGREIQLDFLPSLIPEIANWEIVAFFHPAHQVAGDFYDIFVLPGGYVGLVIADVCDHGVGAALFMGLFRSLIRIFSGQTNLRTQEPGSPQSNLVIGPREATHAAPLKAISITNEYIASEHGEMAMFATIFFGVLDPETGVVLYINGGHDPVFLIGPHGVKERLRPTGPAVGMLPDASFTVGRLQMDAGDVLLGLTDGVTEAHSPEDELFTVECVTSLLEKPVQKASDAVERIKRRLFEHIDSAPQYDDITMLAIRRESPRPVPT